MSVVPIDIATARGAVERLAGQVEELLRFTPDTSVPVPGLEWTAGETGAHLVTVTSWFSDYAAGRRTPPGTTREISILNARRIAEFTDRDGSRLASHLHDAVQNFLTDTAEHSGDDPFPWFDEYTIDVADGTCILLGELIVHGLDLARAVGRPWPIDPDDARLAIAGTRSLLPLYVDRENARGVRASYEIRVKGSPSVFLRFADGEVGVTPAEVEPVDCRITADPVAYLLFSYGRIGQMRPIVRGKLIAWGRKPWLGLKLGTLLQRP
ncbi:MAG: maleylpyruvate isomerase family mycothiol-dependent enzyme [Acidimicrobiia bacterium]|nr:maleylpyruvate isomerase family mycothiol-dependent enzyme [Acidimicrobiia bacterium]